jgi:hypothetical protein
VALAGPRDGAILRVACYRFSTLLVYNTVAIAMNPATLTSHVMTWIVAIVVNTNTTSRMAGPPGAARRQLRAGHDRPWLISQGL